MIARLYREDGALAVEIADVVEALTVEIGDETFAVVDGTVSAVPPLAGITMTEALTLDVNGERVCGTLSEWSYRLRGPPPTPFRIELLLPRADQ